MPDTTYIGPFSQTLFLGASIIRFSASIGWNGDQGQLEVEVVEDPCRGPKTYYDAHGNAQITQNPDFFNPPKMGSPVYFRFGNFSYGGILQNWEQIKDTQAGKTFSIRITDPIEILEGCSVIINGYTGSVFGVPNLINAFGYNESLNSSCNTTAYLSSLNPPMGYTPAPGFGGANVAQDGMSWYQIKDAILTLVNVPSNVYGGSLQLREHRFYLDISELPILDANFRIQGDSTNILDLINQICSSTGCDFYTEILYFTPSSVNSGYGGTAGHIHPDVMKFIKVRVVQRLIQRTSANNVDITVGSPIEARLELGKLSRWVGNGGGATRIARGLELRHDVTNSFLVGDNRQDLWQQAYSGSQDTFTDTIWPYWGKDQLGFPIVSTNEGVDHEFTVSTLGWGDDIIAAVGNTYTIKIQEIRAALDSMETWSAYMEFEKPDIAEALSLDAVVLLKAAIIDDAKAAGKPLKPDDLKDTRVVKAGWAHDHANYVGAEGRKVRLYEIIRSFGELAGKKFMVALPLICSAVDQDALFSLKMNWQITDGGWTDADVQVSPLADALPPASPILELLRIDDGRIQAFVYFNTNDETSIIDYSLLSPDEVIPISNTECYVKAKVEEITFLNPVAQTYPRAIVTINNPVVIKQSESEIDTPMMDALRAAIIDDAVFMDKLRNRFGDDTNKFGLFPLFMIPRGAAVPLRSTNLCYGPWVTTLGTGPAAKTNFERNTALSPWAFGSTQTMNYAGQIVVETQVTKQIVGEAGSTTFPGAPPGRLGNVLDAGGPEITNIQVDVGVGGVVTSLRMRTWVPNFGELGRRRVQTLQKTGIFAQKLQRAFIRNNLINGVGGSTGNWVRMLTRSDRFNRNSSHTLLVGEYIDDYRNENHKRTNVALTDTRKAMPELYRDYQQKAAMDLTGMFRPFATQAVAGQGLPAFSGIEPTSANPVTALSLNPFKTSESFHGMSDGHDIDFITRGESISGIVDLSIVKQGSYGSGPFRGLGLRAPLVLVGWGFDLNDKPVPNSNPANPTNNFATNYLRRPDLWKAGPLDVRWDETKGVWRAKGGGSVRVGATIDRFMPRTSGIIQLVRLSSSGTTQSTEEVVAFDWLMQPGQSIAPSTRILVGLEETSNQYYILNPSCYRE